MKRIANQTSVKQSRNLLKKETTVSQLGRNLIESLKKWAKKTCQAIFICWTNIARCFWTSSAILFWQAILLINLCNIVFHWGRLNAGYKCDTISTKYRTTILWTVARNWKSVAQTATVKKKKRMQNSEWNESAKRDMQGRTYSLAPRWAPKMYTRFVSHSKPFYPNDSMSSECLDAGLELPIHGVQEASIPAWKLSAEP